MRILVSESGAITTEHDSGEFDMLKDHVASGSRSLVGPNMDRGVEPGNDVIGPMVVTAQAAVYLAKVIERRRDRSAAVGALTHSVFKDAQPATDIEGNVVIQWKTPDEVAAVRSRMLYGLMVSASERGILFGAAEGVPGEDLYEGLHIVEDTFRLSPADAIARAALFNDAGRVASE